MWRIKYRYDLYIQQKETMQKLFFTLPGTIFLKFGSTVIFNI